jgi:hypothetical protein
VCVTPVGLTRVVRLSRGRSEIIQTKEEVGYDVETSCQCSIGVLFFASLPTQVFADKPSFQIIENTQPFTLPSALTGCGFDVVATPINSKERFTLFVDQNGDPRILFITGPNLLLLTNASTGKSVQVNSSAPGRLTLETGPTFHALVQGTAILINAVGAVPDFPQFAFTKGKLDMITTLDFITLQVNSFNGVVQNVCSLLS